MGKFRIEPYNPEYHDRWNEIVEDSNNGGLFHRMDFLSYHGEKFLDNEAHLLIFKGDELFGVMPFAVFQKEDGKKVGISSYGGSFSGLVHPLKFPIRYALNITELLVEKFRDDGLHEVHIRVPPIHYHRKAQDHFEFALSAFGFKVSRRDLFGIVELPTNEESLWESFEGRCRRNIKKGGSRFEVLDKDSVDDFFPILMADKARHGKHEATHSYEELYELKERFPDRIWFDIAEHKETGAKAGLCYFKPKPHVVLTFYIAQEDEAKGDNGLNFLIHQGMKRAIKDPVIQFYDFGEVRSNLDKEGLGVTEFKESFGCRGLFRDTYSWYQEGN